MISNTGSKNNEGQSAETRPTGKQPTVPSPVGSNYSDSIQFDNPAEKDKIENLPVSLDEYIGFTTQVNELAGHPVRKHIRITGDFFLL